MRNKIKKKIAIFLALFLVILMVGNLNLINADFEPGELQIGTENSKVVIEKNTYLEGFDYKKNFELKVHFDMGDMKLKEKDFFTVQLPDELKLYRSLQVEKNPDGSVKPDGFTTPIPFLKDDAVVGYLTFDEATNKAKVEFTKEVENKIEVTGFFKLNLALKVQEQKEVELKFTVGQQEIVVGKIKAWIPAPPVGVNGENFAKSDAYYKQFNGQPSLEFFIRINRGRADRKMLTIFDEIQGSKEMKFIPESFQLFKVNLNDKNEDVIEKTPYKSVDELLNPAEGEPHLKISKDRKKFELIFPNNGTNSYRLVYHVVNPVTGETFNNIIYARDEKTDLLPYEGWTRGFKITKSQKAVLSADMGISLKSGILIKKVDFNDRPLKGVQFKITRNSVDGDTKESLEPIFETTDENGEIQLKDNLKNTRYFIEEVEAPKEYEKAQRISVLYTGKPELAFFVNNPKLVDISVTKVWEGDDVSEYKAQFGLERKVEGKEFEVVTDEFDEPLVYQLDSSADKPEADNPLKVKSTFKFEKLRQYDDDGNVYEYRVVENKLPQGYQPTVTKVDGYTFEVLNKEEAAPEKPEKPDTKPENPVTTPEKPETTPDKPETKPEDQPKQEEPKTENPAPSTTPDSDNTSSSTQPSTPSVTTQVEKIETSTNKESTPESEPTTEPKKETPPTLTGDSASSETPNTEVLPGSIPVQNQSGNTSSANAQNQKTAVDPQNMKKLPKTGEGLNSLDYSALFIMFGFAVTTAGYMISKKRKQQ